jgi:hypothetical protein
MIVPGTTLPGSLAFPTRGFSRVVLLPPASCWWAEGVGRRLAACVPLACCRCGASPLGRVVVHPASDVPVPVLSVRWDWVCVRRVGAMLRGRDGRRLGEDWGSRSRWGRGRGTHAVLHLGRNTLVGGGEEADEEAGELCVLGGGSGVLHATMGTRASGRREAEWLGGSGSCVKGRVRLVAGTGWAAARGCCSALEPRS